MAAWIRLVHVRPINRLDTRSKEKVALFCLLLSVLPFASFSMFFCVAPSSLIFAIFFFLFVFSPETWSESVGLNPVFCAPVAFVQHYWETLARTCATAWSSGSMYLDAVNKMCKTWGSFLWSMKTRLVRFIRRYSEHHFRDYAFPPINAQNESQCGMLDDEGIKDDLSLMSIYVKRNGYRCLHSSF